ncbi:hypothetical protein ACFOZ0_21490 [Streptomyces yaanensis]|uniref:Peptidoglycan binding domain-containing protein n=1 Tax=Streptomyces yaanensis TaxID=1142239 RepID=A0ABV7SI00_9ACTN|nr:hypothetical protein [Streptomyces sp. CGMCC 4.7035]WNB97592.1 hypothetical protein Q2K21_05600 [Streptomyces sp. CGMCC 4.7035]
MSRETDSSSAGPNGRGGAAYPSGTPPYGTPMASVDGVDASRSATQPEERKTETTLTTRIRINIPGSRPIPPVVVRTPVAEADSAEEAGADTKAPSSMSGPGTLDGPAEPAAQAQAEEKTSDWFAPRKSAPAKGPQGGGSANGAGLPGASGIQGTGGAPAAPGGSGAGAARPGGPGANTPGGARPGASGAPGGSGARPAPGTGGSAPLGARPGGTNGKGLPGATGAGPVAPGHGGGTGSFDVSDAVAATTAQFPVIGTDDAGEPSRDGLPYFSDAGRRGPAGPSGPTGGPVTGDGPVIPPAGPSAGLPSRNASGPSAGGPGRNASGPGVGVPGRNASGPSVGGPGPSAGGPGLLAPGFPGTQGGPGGPLGPGAPAAPGVPGAAPGQGRPGGGISDDTAVLTPQKPAPGAGPQGYGGPRDNVSGHTVTSGIPVVPPGAQIGSFSDSPSDGAVAHTAPKLPDPPKTQSAPSGKPAKKKGRSKLVLLVGGVVFLGGVAYGAGLLMNHSDVPKGTTVFGVDIGGGTRDEAIQKLDAALGSRTDKPIQLSVDGKTVSLKPDQAGLQFDSKATVAAAAKSDYNPVSVVGSLFGQQRAVEPVMPVDVEKLQAALERAGGGSGSMTDGTIKFESGKAVAVYGKAGKGIDAAGATAAVEQAYRTQVETNASTSVKVPTTIKQPTISNAEVDRMMKEFAEPAMSERVTIQTDATHRIQFGSVSLPKILGVKAVGGKLQETYDLNALKEAYGSTFDGVLITRGSGQKTAVTPQDVASVLSKALRGKTAAERIGVIATKPS